MESRLGQVDASKAEVLDGYQYMCSVFGTQAYWIRHLIRLHNIMWLSSYFSNCRLQAVAGCSSSSHFLITAGVLQGGMIGLTFSILYVKNLVDILPNSVTTATYADGIAIFSFLLSSDSVGESCRLESGGVCEGRIPNISGPGNI